MNESNSNDNDNDIIIIATTNTTTSTTINGNDGTGCWRQKRRRRSLLLLIIVSVVLIVGLDAAGGITTALASLSTTSSRTSTRSKISTSTSTIKNVNETKRINSNISMSGNTNTTTSTTAVTSTTSSISGTTTNTTTSAAISNNTLHNNTTDLSSSLELDSSIHHHCDIIQKTRLYSPQCNNTGQGVPRRLLITATGRSGTTFLTSLLRDVGLQVSHDNLEISVAESMDGAVSWVHAFDDQHNHCQYPKWAWRQRQRQRQRNLLNDTLITTTTTSRRNLTKTTKTHDPRNFLHVIHLVRDPLLSIRSRWNLGDIKAIDTYGNCHTTQNDFLPAPATTTNTTKEDVALRKTLRHWVLWNSFIESYATTLIPMEALSGQLVTDIYHLAASAASLHDNTMPLPPLNYTVQEIDTLLASSELLDRHSNADHTHKPNYEFNWDMLHALDPDYAIMAQLMAQRYGYSYNSNNNNNSSTNTTITTNTFLSSREQQQPQNVLNNNSNTIMKQVCGFTNDNHRRWTCRLQDK